MVDLDNSLSSPRRLEALRRSGLLDARMRPLLDRLTETVRTRLHVPVALVSLLQSDRQIFSSQCGLPEPYATAGQTRLSHSF